ncbi:hypothetical protein [Rhizosaccharibacter radicis]|uniref:Uncharacterized protein n=1 Tax=Rhizosaccharibacter radicis TaxID=2782605 RepID=A0ABT1VW47_9PROT|nr:hypothetical protein [Acetobacteraceae bacterium KSS12]
MSTPTLRDTLALAIIPASVRHQLRQQAGTIRAQAEIIASLEREMSRHKEEAVAARLRASAAEEMLGEERIAHQATRSSLDALRAETAPRLRALDEILSEYPDTLIQPLLPPATVVELRRPTLRVIEGRSS